MQTPLDFGPSRGLRPRLPSLGGRTIPQAVRSHDPHPSSLWTFPSASRLRGLAADRPLFHPKAFLPYPRSRRGHRPIGSSGLVASALGDSRNLSASPAGTTENDTGTGRLAAAVHRALKLPHAMLRVVTFLTPLASNPEGLKDR